jgi:hypothetical protein
MGDREKNPDPRVPATANQKRNEVLRTEGRAPETPIPGYRFGQAICLTPQCRGVVKYEVSTTRPWRVNTDHVICGHCAATYQVTVTNADTPAAEVTIRNADDRQS